MIVTPVQKIINWTKFTRHNGNESFAPWVKDNSFWAIQIYDLNEFSTPRNNFDQYSLLPLVELKEKKLIKTRSKSMFYSFFEGVIIQSTFRKTRH